MDYHRKDIGDHIETIFRPVQERLREEHQQDLNESRCTATKTNNGAALLPAEAASYIRHIKALTVARAQIVAEAYTAFHLPSGDAGAKDLVHFYNAILAARRSAFQGHASLVAKRTGRDLGQLSGLLRSFERDAQVALLEGKSILSKQAVSFQRTQVSTPMRKAKRALSPSGAEAMTRKLLTPETMILGKLLWFLLRANSKMTDLTVRRIPIASNSIGIQRNEGTEFAQEVGRDEIDWWINRKEIDIPEFAKQVAATLRSAQALKEAALRLKKLDVETYDEVIAAFQRFAAQHLEQVGVLYEFARWLYERDALAPSILFTYKVWGSTRRGDRMSPLTEIANSPDDETLEVMQKLTESAWGFTSAGLSRYVRAELEIGYEMYEASLGDGQKPSDDMYVPEARVVRRAAREITDECSVFFEFLRNSLRDIERELKFRHSREARLTSDRFWKNVITKARKSPKAESMLWDFKETLSFWHITDPNAKRRAKQELAKDVASFANSEGGCLIVGVTDDRRVVGVANDPRDIENRLNDTYKALDEHFSYPRSICRVQQVAVADNDGNERLCFVITVARACEPAAAQDGSGAWIYPVRQGSGTVRADRLKLHNARIHDKNDRFTFLDELEQFAAEA